MKIICIFILTLCTYQLAFSQTANLENLKQLALKQSNNADAWMELALATDLYADQMFAVGNTSEASLSATEAQDFFQMAVSIAPYQATYWKKVGLHYLQKKGNAQKNALAALAYLQRAEALSPNDSELLISLKNMYTSIGQAAKSKQFDQRIKLAQSGAKQSSYHKF